ncbi:MAG: hypothetical protein RL153_495 [Verrucomicrobiota bacterium]|jgi:hypothetical protein
MAQNDDLKDIAGAVQDAVAYPILTQDVGGSASRSGGANAGGSPQGGSLTRTAQSAIRDLLGWRYRSDDPKGFVAALTKAVDLKDVQGHVEWSWKPRPFMVHADMGEVTGAQASLYARAKSALSEVLGRLDVLAPRIDADRDATESLRSLVRTAWTELVAEMGVASGPRIQRVDGYFRQLLGASEPAKAFNSKDWITLKKHGGEKDTKPSGTLHRLAHRFGLDSRGSLTVGREGNVGHFLIILDHTYSLLQTWDAQKEFLRRTGGSNKFLGTQLVRFSEELAVIAESVQEVYAAMDSVFFGPEERQVAVLTLQPPLDGQAGQPDTITVAELLDWIESFATVEAPQMVEDSGRDGVLAAADTLARLSSMLNAITKPA